ncbi:hypothetical protein BDV37DRAFT_289912 [Aspergillus pseudonomiae]|uniref:Uncharacterized protein n=1 Tax=Aspergillus pseudonomiae TaxID=1506151 RepID=A0A5N7CRK3_9EURO|nr:uncharacterized protein BDV37DRAFT_289912 [Aspergillus pseudonomiae]KAE8396870.1 hypothetical protein BDV37DRAFT_289912 [Aspergillus pseudonomiae]
MSLFNQRCEDFEPNPYSNSELWPYNDLFNPYNGVNHTFAQPGNAFLNNFASSNCIVDHSQFNASASTTLVGDENVGLRLKERGLNNWGESQESVPPTELPSEFNCQKTFSEPSERNADGIFNIDNFSVTSSGDTSTVAALHSSIDNFSTAIQNLTTEAGSISETVERHSSVIDAFALKFQNIPDVLSVLDIKTSTISNRVEGLEDSLHEKIEIMSNRVDILASSLHDKMDNISGRVDKLAEMVEKVVKCERLAMEKFGHLTKRMEHPVSFQSQSKAAVDLRRRSPLDQI